MADIVTNTLQIGSNNLVLRDADAQTRITTLEADTSTLKEEFADIGLSVVEGKLNITYQEVSE